MYYAKAMIKPSLEVVVVLRVDFNYGSLEYWTDATGWHQINFDNVVWLKVNERPIIE